MAGDDTREQLRQNFFWLLFIITYYSLERSLYFHAFTSTAVH